MRTTLLATALLAVATAVAVPAVAQNANANDRAHQNQENRGNRGNGGTETAGTRGQQNRADREETGNNGLGRDGWNYGRVISSLRNGTADDIDDVLADADSIGLLALSTLGPAAQNASALGNALAASGQTEEEVQAAIEANQALADAIAGAGYDPADVIGFAYGPDGQIILIVKDV